jgi:GNAT superfamily N-acetyltransferase
VSKIEIRPVRTRRERRRFLTFPWRIYRDDPLWVPPLLPDRTKRIDPRSGPIYARGELALYMAWQSGEPVGTISVANDVELNELLGMHEATFGFFECVQDEAVAEALLGRAAAWAQQRGLSPLVGPFHLDREDSYGVLVDGRDRPPAMLCGHTPPYYQDYLKHFGFVPARADNLAYAIDLEETPALRRLSRLADRLRARGRITIREPDLAHWEDEVDRVHHLLDRALAHLPDAVTWRRSEVCDLLAPFVRIADPELILFAEVDGETVGFFPGIANLNEALQHANGLRYPWDYVRLWWHMRRQPASLAIKSVLVLPEYWDTGVAVLLFDEMARRARAKGYQWVDLSLTSDDNPYTPTLAARLGAVLYKRYRVYQLDLGGDEPPRGGAGS